MNAYDWLEHGVYFFEPAPTTSLTAESAYILPARAAPRDLPKTSRLLTIAQRLKRERDRARRERDVNNAVLELWLASLWRDRNDSD